VIEPMTKRTLTGKSELRAVIEAGRARGWYLNQEESQDGVTTLSAPFRWSSAVYIVTVAGPSSRLDHRLERAARLITQASAALGAPSR
jgi:DNA-binding IclR family transcriptional regulator